ncbi:Rrf2 family transcriptional regulator [Flavihumibacter sp. R14]|nr:Rrf2 family transcriptional regulator [Flavihumibacter soli]
MKITAQEEYGLRVLIRIAANKSNAGLSIPQLTELEGLSVPYVAKLTRILRMGGFINSTPGHKGGYILARPAALIGIKEVLKVLGGVLFSDDFCNNHSGTLKLCSNSVDCSSRSLWNLVQITVDQLLDKISLDDLVHSEQESSEILKQLTQPKVALSGSF